MADGMETPPVEGTSRGMRHAGFAFALLLAAWAARVLFLLARDKGYSIDEFQYAHAAWAMAHGQVPYRDFFEHHFPLLYQLLSVIFRVVDGTPDTFHVLRLAMFPVAALGAAATWAINRGWGRAQALWAPAILACCAPYAERATEIRPDALAFTCISWAVAILYPSRLDERARAMASGALLVLATWASQKTVYVGVVFPVALVMDAWSTRRGGRAVLLRPGAFVVGAAVPLALIMLWLLATSSAGAWFHWTLEWMVVHQAEYRGFPWTQYFLPFLQEQWWVFVLACVGLPATLSALRSGDGDAPHPDTLLIGCLGGALISFAVQKAAFSYSLIPFCGFLSVFAGRGVAAAWQGRRNVAPHLAVFVSVLSLVMVVHGMRAMEKRTHDGNTAQRATHRLLDELTAPDDAVYDNSGSYVARPHAYFMFFTDSLVRQKLADQLNREVPEALRRTGCVAVFQDMRHENLPGPVKTYLSENYQPFNGDLWLHGRRFAGRPSERGEAFHAMKKGRYFVEPAALLDAGTLEIDGRVVTSAEFDLEAGGHVVKWTGPERPFHVLWMPRNGKRWVPQGGARMSFSVMLAAAR